MGKGYWVSTKKFFETSATRI